MVCPLCNINLLLSEKQGIEIDYCPKCRGMWLDRGELEKIIGKTIEVPSSISNNHRGVNREYHHDDDEYKHPSFGNNRYKKKSFLGDLFDF